MQHIDEGFFFLLYAKGNTRVDLNGGAISPELSGSACCPVFYCFINRDQMKHHLMMIET